MLKDLIKMAGRLDALGLRKEADFVDRFSELNRVSPVVDALAKLGIISVDTRKADVAREAISQGAMVFNDVSALSFDPRSFNVLAESIVLSALKSYEN